MTTRPNDPNECHYNWRESDPGLWTCEPGSHSKLQLFTPGMHLGPLTLRIHVRVEQRSGTPTWALAREVEVPVIEVDPGVNMSPIECAEISYWDWLRTLCAEPTPHTIPRTKKATTS